MLVRKVTVTITKMLEPETLFFLLKDCNFIHLIYDDESITIFEKIDNSHFFPSQGKYLVDCSYELTGNYIHIKSYSLEEITSVIFLSFNKQVHNSITSSTCSTSDFTHNYKVNFFMPSDYNTKNANIILNEEWVISYPATITFLESVKLVNTKKSEYWLATDERVFTIDGEEWFEVDILGTMFGDEISETIKNMYHLALGETVKSI